MKPWQTLLLILIVSLVIAGSFTTLMIRYINARDARLINQAIHQNDLPTVQKIVQKNKRAINSLPTLQPQCLQICFETPEYYYPLQCACSPNEFEILKYLIENGADCNLVSRGIGASQTPLMLTVIYGCDAEVIRYLLDHGADKSATDCKGQTALDYAIQYKREALIPILKEGVNTQK